jgi:hypothetical protein
VLPIPGLDTVNVEITGGKKIKINSFFRVCFDNKIVSKICCDGLFGRLRRGEVSFGFQQIFREKIRKMEKNLATYNSNSYLKLP